MYYLLRPVTPPRLGRADHKRRFLSELAHTTSRLRTGTPRSVTELGMLSNSVPDEDGRRFVGLHTLIWCRASVLRRGFPHQGMPRPR